MTGMAGTIAREQENEARADWEADQRRDAAHAAGCRICPTCEGYGAVNDDPEVRGALVTCHKCNGETWIDVDGRPYKID